MRQDLLTHIPASDGELRAATLRESNYAVLAVALVCLGLAGCNDPAVREPSDQQADVFMNKIEADEKADRDVAVGEARFEEAERARAAEVRLEDAANQVRQEGTK